MIVPPLYLASIQGRTKLIDLKQTIPENSSSISTTAMTNPPPYFQIQVLNFDFLVDLLLPKKGHVTLKVSAVEEGPDRSPFPANPPRSTTGIVPPPRHFPVPEQGNLNFILRRQES